MKDTETKIWEMKKKLRDFTEERNWQEFHTPKDLAIAVSVEAAELLEHFRFRNGKKLDNYLKEEENRKEIAYEMADVLSFLVRMADEMKIDIAAALKDKMDKNSKRYPIGISSGDGWMEIKKQERRKKES